MSKYCLIYNKNIILKIVYLSHIGDRMLRGVCYLYSETGTEGGYWAFQDNRYITPRDWPYEGLHILENGDQLTIYSLDNPTQIVWSGTISLRQHLLFSERVFGFWIHADQEGIEREKWATYFLKEYPAELTFVRK